jgi:transcription antitermination factor NusA-like protein
MSQRQVQVIQCLNGTPNRQIRVLICKNTVEKFIVLAISLLACFQLVKRRKRGRMDIPVFKRRKPEACGVGRRLPCW